MALETKGKSKINAKEVIAARRLKAANPEMSMQAIKDKLGLEIHVIMVGRAIRGITHSHLDMCGLPVRPFGVKAAKVKAVKPAAKKVAAKKVAKKVVKKAPKKVATPKSAKTANVTDSKKAAANDKEIAA